MILSKRGINKSLIFSSLFLAILFSIIVIATEDNISDNQTNEIVGGVPPLETNETEAGNETKQNERCEKWKQKKTKKRT